MSWFQSRSLMATSANGGQPEACAFSNIFWYSWEKVLRYEELLFVQLVEINPRHLAAYMANQCGLLQNWFCPFMNRAGTPGIRKNYLQTAIDLE